MGPLGRVVVRLGPAGHSFTHKGPQMALTHTSHVLPLALWAQALATHLKALEKQAAELLDTNSDYSIDWAAGTKPAVINEDSAGNIDGTTFSRSELSNVIGSLLQLQNLLRNQAVTQGDHLANVNKVAAVNAEL